MTSIVISSGHGKYVRGASGYIDEVNEARRVVEQVAEYLDATDIEVTIYHDNVSTTQSENLTRIVDFHNSKSRDLDVSVHFNAYETTSKPMGTECLYVTQEELAADVADAISVAGDLIDRGPKYRSDLKFLNATEEPAILIEVCFVDSSADVAAYQHHFATICRAIAESISGMRIPDRPGRPERPERPEDLPPIAPSERPLLHVAGPVSWFGGPDDSGVSSDEGLAFLYEYDDAPHLFLDKQPAGTTGLARRLDPDVYYVACRWDYAVTPKDMLRDQSVRALVRAGEREYLAFPADWGPHEDTGRVADISPGLMEALDLETDDEVEVIYPAPESATKVA
jgi:N-acetylmuramoyl-L-alanine amidase